MKKKNYKKGEYNSILMQHILMALIFAGILLFGAYHYFNAKSVMTENEIISIKNELETYFKECSEDPLNKGRLKTIKINANKFDSICLLGEYGDIYAISPDMRKIYESNNNLVFFNSDLNEENLIIKVNYIIGSININYEFERSTCISSKNREILEIPLTC